MLYSIDLSKRRFPSSALDDQWIHSTKTKRFSLSALRQSERPTSLDGGGESARATTTPMDFRLSIFAYPFRYSYP